MLQVCLPLRCRTNADDHDIIILGLTASLSYAETRGFGRRGCSAVASIFWIKTFIVCLSNIIRIVCNTG